MENRLRLAPSPTGLLHIGTARTALFNWLFAKKSQGKFLLRIEDTDIFRSKPEFTKNILDGLSWLGLNWDEDLINQSERIEEHKVVIKKLLDQGLAYRCFMSEKESQQLRETQKKSGLAPKHDNRYRDLSKSEIENFINAGKFKFQWHGLSNKGIPIASGIYLVMIEHKDTIYKQKITFLK